MFSNRYKFIFIVTLLSGAAGLIYEITWTRMMILIFGYSTHSVVAVLSAFLGGLAIGAYFFGRYADNRRPVTLLKLYSILEICIGLFAILTIYLFPLESGIYSLFSDGSVLTNQLLLIKFLLTTIIILPPTILMGATLPILVSILRVKFEKIDKSISLLYCFNTFGALIGVLVASFITIELFGISATIFIGAALNVFAGLIILVIPRKGLPAKIEKKSSNAKFILSSKEKIVLLCFFISGFISIAYEILWTRALTPVTGTYIHSFALILGIYLLGIAIGSILFNIIFGLKKNTDIIFAICEFFIGFFALVSVAILYSFSSNIILLTSVVVFPASVVMGISFPSASALLKDTLRHGRLTGLAYFFNTVGCVLGGVVASFMFIPLIGTMHSIVLCAGGNFILCIVLLSFELKRLTGAQKMIFISLPTVMVLLVFGLFLIGKDNLLDAKTRKWIHFAQENHMRYKFSEDDVSSVMSINEGNYYGAQLIVNGVGITGKAIDTRLMAHIPLAFHRNPKTALDVCFGMGSTYRSLLQHGLKVDAIELSPQVANSFSFFYPDGPALAKNGKGKIIINDGRNYVNLTHKKYDIVTIDPPPPFNSAGTTVLYSKEFYQNMQRILNKNGIVMQWIDMPNREDDLKMAIKTFIDIFPYAFAIKSPGVEPGYYMIGSFQPIDIGRKRIDSVLSSKPVQSDFREFRREFNTSILLYIMINKNHLEEFTKGINPITDNNPRTEFYILRHLFTFPKTI